MTLTAPIGHEGLLGTNEILVAEAVVTPGEQATLLRWVEEQYRGGKLLGNPQDAGAQSTPFRSANGQLTRLTDKEAGEDEQGNQKLVWVPDVDIGDADPLPDEFWKVRERVVDLLGLSGLDEDPYKGSFMSYIAPGAGVHQHRDARLRVDGEEMLLLRCNVLFKKPQEGGRPVVEYREIDVPDRGMWVFFPSERVHAATLVQGSEFRGLLSFGFVVRSADLWQRRFQLSRGFAQEYGLDASEAARSALLAQLTQAWQSRALDQDRLELFEFVVTSRGDYSVDEAARSLRRSPEKTGGALEELQRANVVESRSSSCAGPGRVLVL